MTITVGTAATNTLIGVAWHSNIAQADVRTINNNILDDLNVHHPMAQIGGMGGFTREGRLYVPNRGPLQLYDGDVVAYDPATGGVVLITKLAAAGASWVHT